MVQLDAEKLRALAVWVTDCANSYFCEYPFDLTERAQASNVQAALKELGFEVSVADAAAIWESCSGHLHAGWMTGAETLNSARETLLSYCVESAAAVDLVKMTAKKRAAVRALGFEPKYHEQYQAGPCAGDWYPRGAWLVADSRMVLAESQSIVAAGGAVTVVDGRADELATPRFIVPNAFPQSAEELSTRVKHIATL